MGTRRLDGRHTNEQTSRCERVACGKSATQTSPALPVVSRRPKSRHSRRLSARSTSSRRRLRFTRSFDQLARPRGAPLSPGVRVAARSSCSSLPTCALVAYRLMSVVAELSSSKIEDLLAGAVFGVVGGKFTSEPAKALRASERDKRGRGFASSSREREAGPQTRIVDEPKNNPTISRRANVCVI